MGYAVELYFDRQTEQSVRKIRQALAKEGIPPVLDPLGERPHVSLAVFSDVDCERLISIVRDYAASTQAFAVQLSGMGTFATDENVLYLVPVPTLQLQTIHQEFHHRLEQARLTPSHYYQPGNWVPHCSVEMNIPAERFSAAVELCKGAFRPVQGQFREIGIVEFRPVRAVAQWPLRVPTGPFAQDSAGRTTLFYAAERGDLEQVRRIIFRLTGTGLSPQRLALLEIEDASGLTAADVAEQAGHKEIADLLRSEWVRMEYYE
jgi:2'-5' RNA ligase